MAATGIRTWWVARCEEHVPPGTAWLSPREREWAAGMRFTKRRAEYLVSRFALKSAVGAVLGIIDPARMETRPGADGAPVLLVDGAAAPLSVSLSDRADCAVCLVADSTAPVGCDLELIEPRTSRFITDFLTEPERRRIAEAGPAATAVLANAIWSAKESALKVLHTGLRRDSRSVEVTLTDVDPPAGTWSPLQVRTSEGRTFPGWWCRRGSFVLTVCATMSWPPPAGLDEHSPLDARPPSHRWLQNPLAGPLGAGPPRASG